MTKNPLLTICVTTYNNEKTIEKTMRSVMAQAYPNFEVLVSDNGSTDATLTIVNSFKDSRITVRNNIKKIKSGKWYIGGYDNCNGCLESGLVRGEFVAFWHSDDIYEKDMAKKEVEFLMKHPSAGAVFTLGRVIDKDDTVIGQHFVFGELKNKDLYNFKDIFESILKYGNLSLITPTFMAKTDIFKNVGLFTEEGFETSADLEMWLRIAKKYDIGMVKENLIRRRVGGVSKTYNTLRTKRADYFTAMDYVLKKELSSQKIDPTLLRQYAYQKNFDDTIIATHLVIKNQIDEAKKIINTSFSGEMLRAFFEHVTLLRTKVLALKVVLFFGINLGLAKPLGKVLSLSILR